MVERSQQKAYKERCDVKKSGWTSKGKDSHLGQGTVVHSNYLRRNGVPSSSCRTVNQNLGETQKASAGLQTWSTEVIKDTDWLMYQGIYQYYSTYSVGDKGINTETNSKECT